MAAEDDDMDEKVFGGCEGPEAMYVKLISSDGHEFIVKRDHALTSGTIKAMLSGPGKWEVGYQLDMGVEDHASGLCNVVRHASSAGL